MLLLHLAFDRAHHYSIHIFVQPRLHVIWRYGIVLLLQVSNTYSRQYRRMGTVYIQNSTDAIIYVRITAVDGGSARFYPVSPGHSNHWDRSIWEIAFIYKDNIDRLEMRVVKPDNTYIII